MFVAAGRLFRFHLTPSLPPVPIPPLGDQGTETRGLRHSARAKAINATEATKRPPTMSHSRDPLDWSGSILNTTSIQSREIKVSRNSPAVSEASTASNHKR